MPASLLCLAGVVVFGATVATPGQVASLRGDVLAALAYVANWRFIITEQSYAQPLPGPVAGAALLVAGHRGAVLPGVPAWWSWSPSRCPRARGGSVVVVLAVLSAAVAGQHAGALHATATTSTRVYYGTGTRALELLLGALLALVLAHPAGFVLRMPHWAWEIAGFVGAVVTLAPVGHAPPRPTRGSTRAAWPATR